MAKKVKRKSKTKTKRKVKSRGKAKAKKKSAPKTAETRPTARELEAEGQLPLTPEAANPHSGADQSPCEETDGSEDLDLDNVESPYNEDDESEEGYF